MQIILRYNAESASLYLLLLYGCVSQGLRTTEFMNLLAEIYIESGIDFPI